ncbi:efflux RND transporter permease subunit [candidate division WWE3 bacterium]|nr:efflux RND transporter permease subunit [candidate division WWE3 bacterium]
MVKNYTAPPISLNARITRFFLNRARITLLLLVILVVFGIGSIFMLRTTGFPSPTIDIIVVNTLYPGASSSTVMEQVTRPLESEITQVDGVKSVNSNSLDNVSSIVVNLNTGANLQSVKSEIDSAIGSVTLPDGVDKTTVYTPKVSGDEYYFSLVPKDVEYRPAEMYQVFEMFRKEVEKDSAVASITLNNEIKKEISVTLRNSDVVKAGLTTQSIIEQLKSWGLTLPVVQDANLDDKTYNINLSISGKSLDDFGAIQLVGAANGPTAPSIVRLRDIADIKETYDTEESPSVIGFQNRGADVVSEGISFSIDIADDVPLSEYDLRLKSIIEKYFDAASTSFKTLTSQNQLIFRQYELVKTYNVAEDNQKQVEEVISGMIGGKWDIPLGWIGYIFGGIQLVFLAMLALVSWRAALISAFAVPLSFSFSTIWVAATGNDLNTLVLFSLVLVIGLVVDPALVVLEAIQRKIDSGLSGKDAVIAAVDEIGWGLVLAVVTSLIVFFPFGVVSGVFGQIISYIPLTVIPAIIGSYVVPIVFLAWFGGIFLRRGESSSDDEEKNLWSIARGMAWLNKKILYAPAWIRVVIVVLALVLSVGTAGFYMGTGQVKSVQFAQPEDGDSLLISATLRPQLTKDQIVSDEKALVSQIMKDSAVKDVSPFSTRGAGGYMVKLVDRNDRVDTTATDVAERLRTKLKDVGSRFSDITVNVLGPGPQNSAYPIALGIKNPDLDVQRQIAEDVTKILNSVCKDGDNAITIDQQCSASNKVIERVDNGYDDSATTFVQVLLDREKLVSNGIQPFAVQQIISNLYSVNGGKRVAVLKTGETELDIKLESDKEAPASIDDLKNVTLTSVRGTSVPLSDVASISTVESPPSIRRVNGEVIGVVNAKPKTDFTDQANVGTIQSLVIKSFNDDYKEYYDDETVVEVYSEGDTASMGKSFKELGLALLLAIVLTYGILVVFFNSFSLPLVILFAIPLTFIGIFPALAYLAGGQLGFLEIIGVIILVGIVENVAIFLIDGANQKVRQGWNYKDAIAYASGVRFRPIILTKITTLVSTLPLILFSELYRSLSLVIVSGLFTSGFVSLIISPILYVAFRSVSDKLHSKSAESPKKAD